jgi:signal transduction histidine kinase
MTPGPPLTAGSPATAGAPATAVAAPSPPGAKAPAQENLRAVRSSANRETQNRNGFERANGPSAVPYRGFRSLVARETWTGVRRPADNRVLAGVAAALADMIGVSVLAARWALTALTFFGGVGIAIYIVAWLFLPSEGSDRAIAAAAMADRRTMQLVLATASALVLLMVCASLLGTTALLGAVSPGLVSLAGVVAIWRHAEPADRAAGRRLAGMLSGTSPAAVPTRRRLLAAVLRFLAGAALIAVCTSTLLKPKHLNSTDLTVALAALGVIAGFALILAPWWLRLGRDLAGERRERARAEERAEMAEHLHDSVLQTLALIQRSANNPQQVQRLARAQERELRAWLFDTAPRGPIGLEDPGTLSEALASLQQEVESVHGVRVEVVTVGDAALDERSRALVAAAREAVVNAAKWSGADQVSIYAEVEPDEISVFVRDRGRGFDPASVATDRKGISESIKARVSRNGGSATVRSAPGEGTEVALKLPRRAQS